MQRVRARLGRIAVAGMVLAAATGVAAASADQLPSSTADVYVPTVDADDLHAAGVDGSGVTVVVIDTGVADLPELDGALVHQQNLSAAPDEGDQYGHGTFVAGLVHATAPGARIISIKLSDASGAVDVTQVLAALSWVVAHKEAWSIDVVNLSFGNDSRQSAATSPLNYAVQKVWDAGIVVVASAGNLGGRAGTVTKPADDPLVISVGASDDAGTPRRGDDSLASYSSRGPTQDGLTKPDLVAPGTRVVSLRAPGSTAEQANPAAHVGTAHLRGSGTSFAAPIVTGTVALMLDANPRLEPDQVKYGLLRTAKPLEDDDDLDLLGATDGAGAGTARALRAAEVASSGRANRGVVRSTCGGSLQAARGSAIVEVETPVVTAAGKLVTTTVPVLGNATVETAARLVDAPDLGAGDTLQDAVDEFDMAEFCDPANWDPSTWTASHWGASQWGASHWGASHWGASHWGASHWGSTQYWASHWG